MLAVAVITTVVYVICLVYLADEDFAALNGALSTGFILITSIGFFLNFKRHGDGKKPWVWVGSHWDLAGEALQDFYAIYAAIFILFATIIIVLGFFRLFDRKIQTAESPQSVA